MLQILRRPDVEAKTGLGKTQIDTLEREGKFPQRRRISVRATGWLSNEIDAWIEALPLAIDADADVGNLLRSTSAADREKGSTVRASRARARQ